METRQISNLRSQDVSKEILSDLVKENVAKFSGKSFYFQYATRETCKGALNNYSMLKLRFFKSAPTLLQSIVKMSPISTMQLTKTPNHIFYCRIAQKYYYAAFFPLKGKLKYIII